MKPSRGARALVMSLAVMALASCAREQRGGLPAADLIDPPSGAFLAYEHDVDILLDAGEIAGRLKATQASCQRQAFGECAVLEVSQQGGDQPGGLLTVRIVPGGVEPMIAAASTGGELGDRSTRAEDLAEAVRDNTLARSRLEKEQARLEEFQQRRDLSVADMIALSQQLSKVEAQRQEAEQQAAQHKRRIDTQKLTLRFQAPGGQSGRSEIRDAVSDFFATLAIGTAWTIRAVAFLMPVLLIVLVPFTVWRRMRRRRT